MDYRPLNAVTIADSYPLPRIQDNLEWLQGAKVFSTLDAAGAYHVIPVEKKTRPLLAFTTPFGLWQFKRLPFGVRNTVSCYSRFMDTLVSRLRTELIIVYLDDILAATTDEEEPLKDLEKVLILHRHEGIKLKAKKTPLFQKSISYLGF